MTPEKLDLAWDLWFDLAQATNDFEPPWTHDVFVLCELPPAREAVGKGIRAHRRRAGLPVTRILGQPSRTVPGRSGNLPC